MVIAIWSDWSHFLFQLSRKTKKKIPINGYEADWEKNDKSSSIGPKKSRKTIKFGILSGQDISDSSISGETEDGYLRCFTRRRD